MRSALVSEREVEFVTVVHSQLLSLLENTAHGAGPIFDHTFAVWQA
jgi:hypothetical protein